MGFNTEDITCLFAGAGAGKTTYIVNQAVDILDKYRPEEVALVSFTRKGAEEAKRRICERCCLTPEDLPYFKTLHSLTFHAMDYDYDQIFTTKHENRLNRTLGLKLHYGSIADNKTKDTRYLEIYNLQRSGLYDSEALMEDFDRDKYKRVISAYNLYKEKFNLIDFYDCLVNFVKDGKALPVKVAFIDEAQDLTALQWDVCYKAFANAEKIIIAGDDYQSIYDFAGARPDILIDIASTHKTVKLEKSYRIPKKIYNVCKCLTNSLVIKEDKDYYPAKNEEGNIIHLEHINRIPNFLKEPYKAKDNTIEYYILARNNCFLPSVQNLLETNLIPYFTEKGFFIGERTLTAIKQFYKFKLQKDMTISKQKFMKKYSILTFDIDFTETNLIRGEKRFVYFSYVQKYGIQKLIEYSLGTPYVFISSVHKVKGGEANNVIFLYDCTKKVYMNLTEHSDIELRLLYVAFTRARHNLFLIDSSSQYTMRSLVDAVVSQYK